MKYKVLYLSLFVLIFSCSLRERDKGALFTLMPSDETHVDFENRLVENEQFNMIQYLYFNNGAGVALGDINNDGLVDIFFTSNQHENKLYLNKGNFSFEDISEKAGISGKSNWKTGVTMADVNGDGWLDVYVCEVGKYKNFHGRNQLFINHGNLTFTDEAHKYGLDFQGFSTQAAFFDYDLDGDLDMYLANHSVHSSRSYGPSELRIEHDPLAGDRLYRNDEKGGKTVFKDVTAQSGIYSSQIGYALAVRISDINGDGYPDIYVSNDFHENDYLYINRGNGTFSEQLTSMIMHTSRSSMGNDIGDFNNDGLMDILVLDMLPDNEKIRKQSGGEDDYELFDLKRKFGYGYQYVRNTLQLNLGGNRFSEIGQLAGIESTDWSWSPLFCDIDNDGWKDIFITSGIYRRANDLDYIRYLTHGRNFNLPKEEGGVPDKILYEQMPLYPHLNNFFRNNRDLTFTNVSMEWGIRKPSFSNGSAWADLDNDGDIDLVVNNINEKAFLYRSNVEKLAKNGFLSVRLSAKGKNTHAIGSRVTVYTGGKKQTEEQFNTRGFLSASSDVLHFGLGDAKTVDSVVIRWPDRSVQIIRNVRPDTFMVCTQPRLTVKKNHPVKKIEPVIHTIEIKGLVFKHEEDNFTEFNREKLIPHSLAKEGPAIATGDLDNDGLDDVFAGGAKSQVSAVFHQLKDGSFKKLKIPSLEKEIQADVVDAAFFDADGDGDQDIYVVKGGDELPPGHPELHDFILVNNGNDNFEVHRMDSVSHNGACVRPMDFDRDGDIDLFVGSRSLPGGYGISPRQFLLENDGKGNFTDVTMKVCPALQYAGMVTGAEWIDYDNDGNPDLAVAGEWMPVMLFRNDGGTFTDVTEDAGLKHTPGLWYSLRVADVDNDGDMDILGGNAGLNTVYHASRLAPLQLYVNDFDHDGVPDPVICEVKNGITYPMASFDELAGQIRELQSRFPNYADFAGKSVEDIFGSSLNRSIKKKVEMLSSCIFINDGSGRFQEKELPVEVQFAPVCDFLVTDINGDGINDLVLGGNDLEVRPSYGRYDASFGWILLGNHDGFTVLRPAESGLLLKGSLKKLKNVKNVNGIFTICGINSDNLQIISAK
jgi:enediyne biosynthesis protein E4